MLIKHQKSKKKTTNYPNLKKHNLNSAKIAKHFGYKSANALRNSSAYRRILEGIESILEEIESKRGN